MYEVNSLINSMTETSFLILINIMQALTYFCDTLFVLKMLRTEFGEMFFRERGFKKLLILLALLFGT